MDPEEVMALGREAANLYGVPPDIYLRLIRRESGFDPERVSSKGAVGLAQLMPATAEGMGVYINDPVENIQGGAKYLRDMYDRFGDWTLAVAAYNAGPGKVERAGNDIPPIRETEEYVANILGGLPLMGENILQPYSDGMPPPRRPENTEDLSALIGIMEDELWTEGGKGERHPALTEFVQSIRDRYRGVEQPKLPYRPRSDIPGTNLKQHFSDGGPVMSPLTLEEQIAADAARQPAALESIDDIFAELDEAGRIGAIAGGISGVPLGSRLGRRIMEEIALSQMQAEEGYADGGPVAGAPNRMAAYQMATRPAAPVTSILDFDPEQFAAALDELGVTAEERAALEQQYFAQQRALPMTERPENMRVGMVAPMAFPEGMTGAEALMSGNFEFTAPELVRGLYEVPAEAANVAGATVRGVPVTEQQMQEAASGLAETITGIGPARAGVRAARGIESLQPNVVSMSGVRGIGDNGGPALEQFDENGFLRLDDIPAGPPRRFIHRNTGLYSPSFEAAKNLPQEVGTPQQMRAALLNSGAKEEELVYSGFDDWLRGKERVTKQEIEEILGSVAAGRDGNMPYMRVSNAAESGITGVQGASLGEMRNMLALDLRRQAIDERNARMESELRGRGYRPIQFADEGEYRQMADRVRALYNNPESRGGLGPDGERLPPGRVMNAITQIDSLVQRQGRSFDDREVQRILSSLADDYDYILGPSGLPEFTDDVVRRELPDFATNPYFGSLPMEAFEQIHDRVNALSQQEVADQLGVSVDDMLANFEPGRSEYGSYVVPGMRNYSENQYMFDDTGRGVLSGIERLGVRPFDQRHFNADKKPLMFFTLTGELNTPEGPAYNLAQIQSDIGQAYNDAPDRFFVPGSTATTLEIPKPQKAALRSYVDRAKEVADLERKAGEKLESLYDNYLSPETGALMKDAPGYRELADEIISLRQAAKQTRDELLQFEAENNDLFTNLQNFYGKLQTVGYTNSFGGDFSADRFEEILAGRADPQKGSMFTSKRAALPFATSTNRWLDAAFKSELVNAAKAGAEWITIPKGDDVQRYTGGDVAGQRKFYGGPDDKGIAPMRLKNLAKKLIPFETEFKDFEATGFGPRAPTYNVFGMRLTPEIRKYILENGLPSFAKGGPVDGSSLDVDVFALG